MLRILSGDLKRVTLQWAGGCPWCTPPLAGVVLQREQQ